MFAGLAFVSKILPLRASHSLKMGDTRAGSVKTCYVPTGLTDYAWRSPSSLFARLGSGVTRKTRGISMRLAWRATLDSSRPRQKKLAWTFLFCAIGFNTDALRNNSKRFSREGQVISVGKRQCGTRFNTITPLLFFQTYFISDRLGRENPCNFGEKEEDIDGRRERIWEKRKKEEK